MIVKDISIPIEVKLIELILGRLALNHSVRLALESELGKRRAGYWGEQAVFSILAELPKNKYFIFRDLRFLRSLTTFKWISSVLLPLFFLS